MIPPDTMTVIAITQPGGPEVLAPRREPLPALGPGDILIRVAAAGVNGPDLAQRQGRYDPPPGASPLPGLEVAGEIAAIGADVTGWHLGDRVMALTNGGGYAEYVAVPARQALPVPGGWDLIDAAALPETWFTITQTLVMRAGLAPGMNVLVHGAAGGIGGAAIQISTILGAKAIAITSSPEKAAYARSLGAVATIDSGGDIAARTLELTDGRGVDRIVDIIGGAMAQTNIAASARGGHIVQISTLDGGKAELSLALLMAKQLTLSGSTLRPQSAETKATIAARIRADLLPALDRPDCPRPRITRFALADAAAAHGVMQSRGHIGKIVLVTPFGAEHSYNLIAD
ncbi:MAG TPA: NAD(P)H-quinone oxidoreductase [Devosia sp.]|nr:NAD(P)H-quinone oxidoreductase [Devosia sp.]